MTMKNLRTFEEINESQIFEAFGKPGAKGGLNPLFKKNFIDMATKAYGYKESGENMKETKLVNFYSLVICS